MSDDEKPPGAIVVHLFGRPPAVEGAPALVERYGGCYNDHSPLLDATNRAVTCGRCKATLDPFDVLAKVAIRHEQWSRLTRQISAMRDEIEALKAEEQRVKARTKSHARKDATEAVAAERDKLAKQRAEIACRVDDARRALKRIDQLIARRDRNTQNGDEAFNR